MKKTKIPDLAKNIIYTIFLFGLSAVLMLTNIYCEGVSQIFAYLTIAGAAAIINGFAVIAVKDENSFCSVANLLCTALWIYPVFTKINDADMDMWVYILAYAALLPAAVGCVTELIGCCIKQEQVKKAAAIKKALSVICIALTIAGAVLTVLSALSLNNQINKEVDSRKEAFSTAAELAENIANDYKTSDLIIEEILDKYQLTYDNPQENYYVVEDLNNIEMIIDNTSDEINVQAVKVSSDPIGWSISRLYEDTLYDAQSEQIELK